MDSPHCSLRCCIHPLALDWRPSNQYMNQLKRKTKKKQKKKNKKKRLTLKAPRKTASENVVCLCRLLNILANFSYRQTVWTLIRLLLREQSDLGPHCLQKWLLKSQADDKADDNSCDWRFEMSSLIWLISYEFLISKGEDMFWKIVNITKTYLNNFDPLKPFI